MVVCKCRLVGREDKSGKDFEITGLAIITANSRTSLNLLEKELRWTRMRQDDMLKEINDKREGFTTLCLEFQKDINMGKDDELGALISEKELLENEIHLLDEKNNALKTSMLAFVEEILEDLHRSNSVTAVFSLAYKLQPAIIFINEVDSFLGQRRNTDHEALTKMKTEFMALWDGFTTDQNARVMVLAATNRPSELDEAILRRIPQVFEIGIPDRKEKAKILKVILKGERVEKNIDYDRIAGLCEGYTGSDLLELCKKAAYFTIRDLLDEEKNGKKSSGYDIVSAIGAFLNLKYSKLVLRIFFCLALNFALGAGLNIEVINPIEDPLIEQGTASATGVGNYPDDKDDNNESSVEQDDIKEPFSE
ncbi:ATPase family AAA domain-containing protein 1-A, partial [Fagus crenata]